MCTSLSFIADSMNTDVQPRFQFIRELMKDYPEGEILEAEQRFARFLDVLYSVAEEEAEERVRSGNA